MNLEDLQHIVVEGPIGAGKSRLANHLAERLGGEALLERSQDNPFLERFYRDPAKAAFPTQLFFLMQRAELLGRVRQGDLFAPRVVADFLFAKDRLFAELNLDAHEFDLYQRVWSTLVTAVPTADLVIYLQAPVSILQERLRRYASGPEASLDGEYLQRLASAYVDFFHHYTDSPVLIVNSAAIDLVDDPGHLEMLLEEIERMQSVRHYFNLDSSVL